MPELPDAQTVVVGGGAVGVAAADALARAGFREILLIEREPRKSVCGVQVGLADVALLVFQIPPLTEPM